MKVTGGDERFVETDRKLFIAEPLDENINIYKKAR